MQSISLNPDTVVETWLAIAGKTPGDERAITRRSPASSAADKTAA
jgi:hypothetical protein